MRHAVQHVSGVSSEYSSSLRLYLHRHRSRLFVDSVRPGNRHRTRHRHLRAAATRRLLLRLCAGQTGLCGCAPTRSDSGGGRGRHAGVAARADPLRNRARVRRYLRSACHGGAALDGAESGTQNARSAGSCPMYRLRQ